MNNRNLYLIDGFALIFRAHFAFMNRPLMDPSGRNISATYGFFKTLFSIIRDYQPSHLGVALESRTPTFREVKFPDYKAHRDKTPQDLLDQIPLIEELLGQLGIPRLLKDGYEADDIIATLSTTCEQEGVPCRIVSGDKDLMQLVNGTVEMLRPRNGGGFALMGPAEVLEDKGVPPEGIIDFLALTGDSADNIPGVPGIGPKTALQLLGEFGSLEGIYQNLENIKSASQRKKLEENQDKAWMSRDLVVLERQVPFRWSWEALEIKVPEESVIVDSFRRIGSDSLAREALQLLRRGSGSPASGEVAATDAPPASGQGELFGSDGRGAGSRAAGPAAGVGSPASNAAGMATGMAAVTAAGETGLEDSPGPRACLQDWLDQGAKIHIARSPEDLDPWIQRIRQAGRAVVDLETDGLETFQSPVVGLSLALDGQEGIYVPFDCQSEAFHGDEAYGQAFWDRLKPLLEDPAIQWVGQNIKFDWKILRSLGIACPAPWFDTMVAAWLLDPEGNSFGMDRLAEQYLDYSPRSFKDTVAKGAVFSSVELEKAAHYAVEDVLVTWRLYEILAARLKDQGLESLYFDMEMPFLDLLEAMERRGILLDAQALRDYSVELAASLEEIQGEIFRMVGHEFNIASPKQLQEVLFVERGLKTGKKTKTGYSTDSSVLEELAQDDPVPRLILRYRGLAKLKSTYVDTLPELINPVSGRIHTHYHQTGTATGRLSSRDPNLQNIPIKEEEGRRIRRAFVAAPGQVFVTADYSQIELVLLAHFSHDPGLGEAFRQGEDIHRATAAKLFGVTADQVNPDQRRLAKSINFGIMYGMSAFRLSGELGIARGQAAEFIETYFRQYPAIQGFIAQCVQEAEETGRVKTLLGRRRPILNINSRNKTEKMAAERIAVNTPIQGSGADIVKLAMLRVQKALEAAGLQARILLQVHDEILIEAPEAEAETVARLLKDEMEAAVELEVPLRAQVEVGSNWGDFH